jgi:predicted DNA-binding protein
MARRELDAAEEERLIADAEQASEDGSLPLGPGRRVDRGPNPSSVISVRLPLASARRLRRLAGERNRTISELLNEAIDVWLAEPPTKVSYFAGRRFAVHSGQRIDFGGDESASSAWTDKPEMSITGGEPVAAG